MADARAASAPLGPAPESDTGPPEQDERLRQFRASVEPLAVPPPERRQRQIVAALRNLGSSLELLPRPDLRAVLEIQEAARKLEDLPADSTDRADVLKDGLSLAQGALISNTPPRGREREYFEATTRLGQAIEALSPDRALLEQQATVAEAFRAGADAIFLARDQEPPFAAGSPKNVHALGSAEAELAEASAAVLDLGRAQSPTRASGQALASLADAIAASAGDRASAVHVSHMRVQAERLKYANPLSFGRSKWIKLGLGAALEAISGEQASLQPWTRAARDAVDGIEEDGSLNFQRGVIQDAFRSTLDAVVVASQADQKEACADQ